MIRTQKTPTYPKIETLFTRGEDFKVDTASVHRPEFSAINQWLVQEKIDGTNIRIGYHTGIVERFIGGRTDRAQLRTDLLLYLDKVFPNEVLANQFSEADDCQVTLFGEGYGPGIQKGGNYRKDLSFRLFDVRVGATWLKPESVREIASSLGVATVPSLGLMQTMDAVEFAMARQYSRVAYEDGGNISPMTHPAEGIIARQPHGMLDRMGRRIMWKLKTKDFPQ